MRMSMMHLIPQVSCALSRDAYGRIYTGVYTSDGRPASLYDATFRLYSKSLGQFETISYEMVKIANTTDLKKYWLARISHDYADRDFDVVAVKKFFK